MPKPKILIVDDEPNMSGLVSLILQKIGRYQVREENTAINVLETARAYRPSLILLDVNMPGRDGGDIERDLRADPELRDTPVIFCSALVSPNEAGGHGTVRGGTRFVSKPVNPANLIQTVREVLAEHNGIWSRPGAVPAH